MKQKLKAMFQGCKRRLVMSAMFAITAVMMAVPAFASTDTFDLSTVMSTSIDKMVKELLVMIAAILPLLLTVFTASIGIAYGTKFVKRIIGKV